MTNKIASFADAVERQRRVRGFMDGIDWQHHLGADAKGTKVYPTAESCIAGEACLAKGGGCGVVEVEIRLIRWVVDQDLKKERRERKPK